MISIVILLGIAIVLACEHEQRTPEQKHIDAMARHDRRCAR